MRAAKAAKEAQADGGEGDGEGEGNAEGQEGAEDGAKAAGAAEEEIEENPIERLIANVKWIAKILYQAQGLQKVNFLNVALTIIGQSLKAAFDVQAE